MSRAMIILRGATDRERAARWAAQASYGTRIEFKETKRTVPQNDRMWAMLTDIAQQKKHCGRRYTPDQWKILFMHACGQEVQFIPSLDNSTFIPWGQRSSDLSIDEMCALIEFMFSWGAEHDVKFHEPSDQSSARADAGAKQADTSVPINSSSGTGPQSPPETKPAPDKTDGASSVGAGISQSSALSSAPQADEERQATESGHPAQGVSSAGLPEGWEREYASVLSEAKAPRYLTGIASKFWNARGGWEKHKSGPNAATAQQIYDAFANHFSDSEARNVILQELNAI